MPASLRQRHDTHPQAPGDAADPPHPAKRRSSCPTTRSEPTTAPSSSPAPRSRTRPRAGAPGRRHRDLGPADSPFAVSGRRADHLRPHRTAREDRDLPPESDVAVADPEIPTRATETDPATTIHRSSPRTRRRTERTEEEFGEEPDEEGKRSRTRPMTSPSTTTSLDDEIDPVRPHRWRSRRWAGPRRTVRGSIYRAPPVGCSTGPASRSAPILRPEGPGPQAGETLGHFGVEAKIVGIVTGPCLALRAPARTRHQGQEGLRTQERPRLRAGIH
jgi:hypothetical protein